jgi:alpha-beta hydrolase superfamily lysophospholipase
MPKTSVLAGVSTVSEASANRVPLLMVHCDGDPVVPASRSLLLQQVLNSNNVPNHRVVISSNAIPVRANWHNIHNDPEANALLLTNVHAWFRAHGVLP